MILGIAATMRAWIPLGLSWVVLILLSEVTSQDFAPDVHQYDGSYDASSRSFRVCFDRCVNDPNCFGFDWDNRDDSCYRHTLRSGCGQRIPINGVDNVRFGTCPFGPKVVQAFPGRYAKPLPAILQPNDILEGGADFSYCYRYCADRVNSFPRCLGIDYNFVARRCALVLETAMECGFLLSDRNLQHYRLVPCQTITPSPTVRSTTTTTRRIITTTTTTTANPEPDCLGDEMDLVFVVDSSGSICDNDPTSFVIDNHIICDNWKLVISFMQNITRTLPIGPRAVQIGFVQFATQSHVRWNLNTYPTQGAVLFAIGEITDRFHGGNTNTAAGIKTMRTEVFGQAGDRPGAPNVAVIITDGTPTVNEVRTIPEAEEAIKENIQIYSVGITQRINERLLQAISSPPQKRDMEYFTSPKFSDLANVLDKIIRQVGVECGITTATSSSTSTTTATSTSTTKSTSPTPIPPPSTCDQAQLDIVFAVDSSGSICSTDPSFFNNRCNNWNLVVDFISNVVNFLTIGPGNTQVGLLLFSDVVDIKWQLNRYFNKNDLLNAVADLVNQYTGGNTNTPGALQVLQDDMFGSSGRGDRSSAQDIAIIITDGVPTVNPVNTIPQAVSARNKGIRIFAIGITQFVNENILRDMSSPPQRRGENYFTTPNFIQLDDILLTVINAACQTPRPTVPTPRPGCVNADLDVVFAVDASGSICDNDPTFVNQKCNNWDLIISFITSTVNFLEIGSTNSQVGLLLFADDVDIKWQLNRYPNKNDLLNAVADLVNQYTGGNTNTPAALQVLQDDMFGSSSRGDRSSAQDIAIIITDGVPTINPENTLPQAVSARNKGIRIFTIGITRFIDEDILREMSSPPQRRDENYFTTPNFSQLDDILLTVIDAACQTPRPTVPTPRPGCVNADLDVVFAVDASGSICDNDPTFVNQKCNNWDLIISFITSTVNFLEIGSTNSQVGLLLFADDVDIKWQLNRYPNKNDLLNAVADLVNQYTGGNTNTPAALRVLQDDMFGSSSRGDRSSAQDIAIIITDGVPTINPENTLPQAVSARNKGIRIFTIGITRFIDEDILREMSSPPQRRDENYFTTPNFSQLDDILLTVIDAACQTPRPTVPTPRPGCVNADLDVVFAVDASGSICDNDPTFVNRKCNNWDLIISFITSTVNFLEIGATNTQVGLLLFADNAEIKWHLNRYPNKNDLLNAVADLVNQYTGGNTNTPAALQVLQDDMFGSSSRGDRSSAQDIAIIITDGVPTINPENTLPQAVSARNKGIRIFTIGITRFIDEDILRDMSSPPQRRDENYFTTPNFEQLDDLLLALIQQACITPTPRPQCVNNKLDIVFAVDGSGSICDNDPTYDGTVCNNWRLILTFITDIVNSLGIDPTDGVRVGLLLFADNAEVKWMLDSYTDRLSLFTAISALKYPGGNTNTQEALRVLRTQLFGVVGDRSDAQNIALVITDGLPTVNPSNTIPEATLAKNQDIRLLVVGITRLIDENTLRDISSSPQIKDLTYFTSPTFAELDTLIGNLITQTCSVIPTTTTTPKPTPPTTCANAKLDLVFAVDGSGSICDNDPTFRNGRCNNWNLMVQFVSDVVEYLGIGRDASFVGLLLFADNAEIKWTLDRYPDKGDLLNAVRNLENQYPGGNTNTPAALSVLQTDIFSTIGDRSDALNIAIVITDGVPTINAGNTIPQANDAKARGITIFAVGITRFIDENILREMSSVPQEKDRNYFTSPEFNELDDVLNALIGQACVTPSPTPRPTPTPTCADAELDIVFAVDASGSICDNDPTFSNNRCNNWNLIVSFVQDIITALNIGPSTTRVGLLLFADSAEVIWNLDRYSNKGDLLNAVRGLENQYTGGNTNTQAALNVLHMNIFGSSGDRSTARNVAIVITDGVPTIDTSKTIPQANEAKAKGIDIFTVGITRFIDEDILKEISSSPHEKNKNYFTSPAFNELDSILDNLISQACVTPSPTPPPTCANAKLDIVFAVDGSGSICDNDPTFRNNICNNWNLIVSFVSDVVEFLGIGRDASQVGLLLFADNAVVKWTLDRYLDKSDLLNAVRDLDNQYPGGNTNTPAALSVLQTDIFSTSGDRSDALNIAIVITDGVPTINAGNTIPQANDAKARGITIFAVGITRFIDENILREMSSSPQQKDRNYFTSPAFNELDDVLSALIGQACVTPSPTPRPTPPQTCANAKLDIVFAVDGSGSICDNDPTFRNNICNNWNLIVSFVSDVVEFLGIGRDASQVGLLLFADNAVVKWTLDRYLDKSDLLNAVRDLDNQYPGGNTNTPAALSVLQTDIFSTSGDRSDALNIAIVITDGVPTINAGNTIPQANDAKARGITIFAVGITRFIDENILREMSSSPQQKDRNYFTSPEFNELDDVLNALIVQTCVTPSPTPRPTPPPTCANAKLDVVFAVDGSGSICDNDPTFRNNICNNWNLIVSFVSDVVEFLGIGRDASQVGLLLFADNAVVKWTLDRYLDKRDLLNAVRDLDNQYPGGNTNTPAALSVLQTDIFSTSGDRSDALNIAIVITDGVPTINPGNTIPQANDAKARGITIFAVGITRFIDENILREMSSSPQQKDRNYFTSPEFNELDDVLNALIVQACVTPPPTCANAKLDVVFAVDGSGSICDNDPTFRNNKCNNWNLIVSFVSDVVEFLGIGRDASQVGLLLFADNAVVKWSLDRYLDKRDLLNAVRDLDNQYPGGNTNTPAALSVLQTDIFSTSGDRSDALNIAIVITDGVPTINPGNTIPQANDAKARGITIFAVGITRFIDENILREMSSSPQQKDRNYFTSPEFNELDDVLNALIGQACVTPSPTPRPTPPPTCANAKLDVVFAVDGSGSICDNDPTFRNNICNNWNLIVSFVSDVVEFLSIGRDASQVGLLLFADNAVVKWSLDRYLDKRDLLNAVRDLDNQYPGGNTNTPAALSVLQTDIFSTSGDRSDALNIAIVITDGVPTINPGNTIPQANDAKARGITIFAVGITRFIDENILREMSSSPQQKDRNYFTSPEFNELDDVLNALIGQACVTPSPTPRPTPPQTCANAKLDVVFAVDGSGSICDNDPTFRNNRCNNWNLIVSFVSDVVEFLGIGRDASQVGLLLFADNAVVKWTLDRYLDKGDLLNAVRDLDNQYPGGNTNTPAALSVLQTDIFSTSGDRSDALNIAIVITDGVPTINPGNTIPQANDAKARGITIFAVGITRFIDENILREMSSSPQQKDRNYFTSPEFNELDDVLNALIVQACVTPSPTPRPTPPPTCANAKLDIVFAVDGSGSICDNDPTFRNNICNNWNLIVSFVSDVVEFLGIGRDASQVGLLLFADNAVVKWTLDRYLDKGDLLNAVRDLDNQYPGGNTNTPAALSVLQTDIFSTSGDRSDALNIAIVITDGVPTINAGNTIPQANDAKARGITIFAVGITRFIDENILREMSSSPQQKDRNYFTSPEFNELDDVLNALIVQACVTPSPTPRPTPPQTCANAKLDVVFAVDGSGSICDNDPTFRNNICNNWNLIVSFVSDVVEFLGIGRDASQVGLLLFADNAVVKWTLDRYLDKRDLLNAVRDLDNQYPGGNTNTPAALSVLQTDIFSTSGDRSDALNIAIVITDGVPTINAGNTIPQANDAKARGITIFAVGITRFIDENILREMSSSPQQKDRNYFTSPEFNELDDVLNALIVQACVTPSPTPRPTPPPTCANAKLDIVFAVDGSGSICDNDPTFRNNICNNWNLIVSFVSDVVEFLGIGRDASQVGLLLFADNAVVKWTLDRYLDKGDLLNAVRDLDNQYPGGNTNTPAALSVLQTDIFSTSGDRSDALNIAIVITDGVPTINAGNTIPQANDAKNRGITIFAVGITRFIDENILREMSSSPQQKDRNYFTSPEFNELDDVLNALIVQACVTPPPTCANAKLDIVFAVDGSGSICDNDPTFRNNRCDNWNLIVSFVSDVVEFLGIGRDASQVGLLLFADNAVVKWTLDRYLDKRDLLNAVRDLDNQYPGGNTNTPAALSVLRTDIFSTSGDRSDALNIAIVITDGVPTINAGNTIPQANDAKARGITIFAVGITRFIDENILREMSSSPQQKDRNYFTSPEFNELDDVLNALIGQACVTPRPTPRPTPPPTCVSSLLDIVFAVDGSGSICDNDPSFRNNICNNWRTMISFVGQVVNAFPIDRNTGVRVGLLIFADQVTIEWTLDRYSEKDELIEAVNNLVNRYPGGNTNTPAALSVLRSQIFNIAGDRAEIPDVAIILTDGVPTIRPGNTIPEANSAKRQGIAIFPVGITAFIDENILRDMSSSPQIKGQNYFTSPSFGELDQVLETLVASTCGPTPGPPTCSEAKLDVVFAVDGSGSICDNDPTFDSVRNICNNWILVVDFVQRIVQEFTIGRNFNQIGLLYFGNEAVRLIPLGQISDKDALLREIRDLENRYPGGNTNTQAAISMMRTQFFATISDRVDAQNVGIIITDGIPTIRAENTIPEANLAKAAGIQLFAVGITQAIREDVLRDISSAPQRMDQNYFTSPDFTELENVLETLIRSACGPGVAPPQATSTSSTTSTTTTSVTPTSTSSATSTTTTPVQPTSTSSTTSTTTTPVQLTCQTAKLDIAFVIDGSGSICDNDPDYDERDGTCNNWKRTITFVEDIVQSLTIGPTDTQVALVLFHDRGEVAIALDQYSSKSSLLGAIRPLKNNHPGGNTNTQDGLLKARTQVFGGRVDRGDATNVAIVITDGVPTIDAGNTIPEANRLKNEKIKIIAVGITNRIDEQTLKDISSSPQVINQSYFTSPNFNDLDVILETLLQATCTA